MKQIDLPTLGGGATRFYLDQLKQLYQATHGNKNLAPIVQTPVDFEQINAFLPDRFIQLTPLLETLFLDIEQNGADLILIPNITLHAAVDRLALTEQTRQKIIHPIHVGIEKLKEEQIRQITLVGTRHTMQSTLIAQYFDRQGIDVLPCATEDIETLDRIRLEVFNKGFSKAMTDMTEEMNNVLSGYGNIVIACTELSILNIEHDTNSHFDLARLQIDKAIQLV